MAADSGPDLYHAAGSENRKHVQSWPKGQKRQGPSATEEVALAPLSLFRDGLADHAQWIASSLVSQLLHERILGTEKPETRPAEESGTALSQANGTGGGDREHGPRASHCGSGGAGRHGV